MEIVKSFSQIKYIYKNSILSNDGDVMNVFRIIGIDMQKRFGKNLNPRYNLFISRMDGKVNKEMIPVKDQLVAFFQFCNS